MSSILPYAVNPINPDRDGKTHEVHGPDGYLSRHGGLVSARARAADLNAAYLAGFQASEAIRTELLEACKDFALGRKESRECEAVMLAVIRKYGGAA